MRQAGGYWAAPPQKNKKEKKSTREGGGKMPVTLQQTSLRSLDNVDSHTHIYTLWHLHAVQLSVLEASTVTRWLCRPEE